MRCTYSKDENFKPDRDPYFCYVFEAHVVDETQPIKIQEKKAHEDGLDDSKITTIRISLLEWYKFDVLTHDILDKYPNTQIFSSMSLNLKKIALDTFENCENLKEIDISFNNITNFESYFKKCKNVWFLSLQLRNIEKFNPQMFEGLENLDILKLDAANNFNITDDFLRDVPKVRELKIISINSLVLNDKILENLIHLEDFECTNCRIKKIHPNAFLNNEKLKNLDLSLNGIESLPDGLFKNQANLEKLNLYANNIKKLSSNSFGHHVALTTFITSFNKIQKIDSSFFKNFPNMERFDASRNPCVNENVMNFPLIDFSSDTRFDNCFNAWFVSSSEKNSGLSLSFLIFITLLLKY